MRYSLSLCLKIAEEKGRTIKMLETGKKRIRSTKKLVLTGLIFLKLLPLLVTEIKVMMAYSKEALTHNIAVVEAVIIAAIQHNNHQSHHEEDPETEEEEERGLVLAKDNLAVIGYQLFSKFIIINDNIGAPNHLVN
ncbi:MAG: hypothetical protein V1838_05560 [Patescibacteria group bacterium]